MEPPPMATPPPAVRVLSRTPPPKPKPPSPAAPTSPNPAAAAGTPSRDGVVAVGFVGAAGTARIADRILDAHVFSPGGCARTLAGSVRYHRDGDRRMVFLHLTPLPAPLETGGPTDGGELPEMLFLFSVCHIIIFLQEDFRFNTQILKKFRLLQSSKHAIAPFVRPLVAAAMPAKSAPSETPTRATHRASSISPPARRGGHNSRQSSAISLMSGTGSNHPVFPGQCVPVLLFVFEDEMVDVSSAVSSVDDTGDTSSSSQASSTDGLSKQSLASNGSGSVVMLARAANKSEVSSSKKLHSSLEGQIRVLLKKCRILGGLEPGHIGSRGVSNMSHHVPLFSLDTSRVVVLLNRSVFRKQEPLDIIAGLFEDSLTSKSSLDIPSLENNFATNHDDIHLIKDFIFRHYDMLRGKGGYSSNASGGSSAGVGMVAAAAAAAAASASAGKTVNAPDLPSFDKWFSISTSILAALISRRNVLSGESEGKTHTIPSEKDDQLPTAGSNVIETALSCLESNNGLNMKFSSSWCQRTLPAAKDIYHKGLPAFYPTDMHEAQLQKALRSFNSMVKGPAVPIFSKKLEDECRTIWESGRQQCDAVSLTGRPCKHQRHGDSSSDAVEQHSSGFVFLHACACGRSRRLRDDPFDFDSANISFNCFSNCEDLLPTLVLPRTSDTSSFPPSAWRLVRLGGARYYKSAKGLLQSGFSSKEKYLLRWMISVGKGQVRNGIRSNTIASSTRSIMDPQNAPVVTSDVKSAVTQTMPQIKSAKLQNSVKQPEMESMNSLGINFGKGLPNFTMKKPFAEVVTGTTTKDSEFPALQHTRLPKSAGRKDERQTSLPEHTNGRGNATLSQGPIAENESEKVSRSKNSENAGGNPYLQIGSNIIPVNVGNNTRETNQPIQQFSVYVGFEHECPHGHRFLLSEKHMNELSSSFLQYQRHYPNKELLQNSSGLTAVDGNSARKHNKPFESSLRNSEQHTLHPRVDAVASQSSPWLSDHNDKKGDHCFRSITIDDGGEAFSLINRNLPIYMHCPHCKNSERKGHQDLKFAGAVSQLQRIFIVTPDFPVLLASFPLVQFERSCLPSNISDFERQGLFSIGSRVILPPESFLTIRLPFIYGVDTGEGSMVPLKHFEQQPELTAWLVGGSALQIVSVGNVTGKEANVK